ncbi:MAG: 5-formyltetrahydrofolate cyclo-ligase [Clostridiales bacterium]|nr:5-formyltetrahydrofolate cyclo-ligase [Clostridiales bacterium]
MSMLLNQLLREEKIYARDSLAEEQRKALSADIVKNILASSEYQAADTILLYRAIRGEVSLSILEYEARADGKRLAYPLCINDTEMAALVPEDSTTFKKGHFGIEEPILEKSLMISPEEIDMVICPCSVFDRDCHRMGMGAGYYDRYLPQCRRDACIAAVAFEVQKADHIPANPWDYPMDMVFTERQICRRKFLSGAHSAEP